MANDRKTKLTDALMPVFGLEMYIDIGLPKVVLPSIWDFQRSGGVGEVLRFSFLPFWSPVPFVLGTA